VKVHWQAVRLAGFTRGRGGSDETSWHMLASTLFQYEFAELIPKCQNANLVATKIIRIDKNVFAT